MMPHIESQAQRDALIAYCKEMLANLDRVDASIRKVNPPDAKYWLGEHQIQRLNYQITLAALEAKPKEWVVRRPDDSVHTVWPSEQEAKIQAYLIRGTYHPGDYTAPPLPALNPVVLSDCDFAAVSHMSGGSKDYCNGFVDGVNHAAKQVSAAGYPIAGADNNHIPDAGKMTGWIKCGDVMPDRNRWVLTCDEAGVTKSYLCMHTGEWINEKGDELYAVTHWMPLPEAPND